MPHIPVLLNEVISLLDPKPGTFFVDGTLGGAGHARAVLERMGSEGKFLGFDNDPHMVDEARKHLLPYAEQGIEVILEVRSYADLPVVISERHLPRVDRLFLDLGFSSDQIEGSGRGFSFLRDEPLLMTYRDDVTPVKEILRTISEVELTNIIRTYGEERFAGRIAKAIVKHRPIETSGKLASVIVSAVPQNYERGRIHPATRTFQALRIFANKELESLEQILAELPAILAPGGRVAIISFHSLEDRLVKRAFADLRAREKAAILTKKLITASRDEIISNPRARSAKLRAVQMSPKP